jgi:Flp pilus assembly protein CpaB
MKSRGLVVAIAVVLAVLAAVGVIVYTSNLEKTQTEDWITVLVSNQDVAANTQLDPLIDQGVFVTTQVPPELVVPGALTSTSEISGKTSTLPIYTNQQITSAYVSGTGTTNPLGISEGHVGLGVEVGGPQSVNGNINNSDQVVVYATFSSGTLVTKKTLDKLLTPAEIRKAIQQALATSTTTGTASTNVFQMQTDFTVTLIPSVKVLEVQNPPTDTSTGRQQQGGSTLVLDLTPEDAEELVFAIGHSELYLGLLPPKGDKPDDTGYRIPGTVGVPFAKVVGLA